MKNSILFSLACLTLVLSGCFNRSTKVWDMIDQNDLDGDGIENACDVDYIDGPVIDGDKNGESDSCQPDTDGDGVIDAIDQSPLYNMHTGDNLNTLCQQFSPSWFAVYQTNTEEFFGRGMTDFVVSEYYNGDITEYREHDMIAFNEFKDVSIAEAGRLLEEAVQLNLQDGDCQGWNELGMLAMGLRADPQQFLVDGIAAFSQLQDDPALFFPRLHDLDGDGIDNDLDPSFDLVVAPSLAAYLDVLNADNGGPIQSQMEAYYYMVIQLIEMLDESGDVDLNISEALIR